MTLTETAQSRIGLQLHLANIKWYAVIAREARDQPGLPHLRSKFRSQRKR